MEEALIDRTGETLSGRYQITGALGGGAMASVYRGLDLRHNTEVAIKILKDEVKDRSSFRDRFEREVLITSKVNHPCCIHKLDFGVRDDGLPYQVMELVPGRSLADLLDEQEALPAERALRIFRQLLQALSVCSDAGIIHRDVKPENILIFDKDGAQDCLKLIDFGIAKLIGEAAEGHEKLTSVGLILGTPHYIAPEWVTSDNVDARADLYSASILLFEMLTSAPPFLSEDRRELMKKHLREPPPTLKERAPDGDFSAELEAMVRKGLAKDPADRFQDARDYLGTLEALSGPSVSGPSVSGPSVSGPSVSGPSVSGPSVSGPSVSGPSVSGPSVLDDGVLDDSVTREEAPASPNKHTLVQPHIANVPPAAPGSFAQPGGHDPATPTHTVRWDPAMPAGRPARRLSPVMIGGGAVVLVALLVTLATLDGSSSHVSTAVVAQDAGQSEVSVVGDAGGVAPDVKPDSPPGPVVPISAAQMAPALAAWKKAGLAPTDFGQRLDDELANGACRVGKVDSVRALLCVAKFDPVTSSKPMRRSLPGESKSRKWRSRIKRGAIQLRVESGSKKTKRTRRKIERVFRKLPK